MTPGDYSEVARRTIRMEAQAVELLEQRIGPEFHLACELILNCSGRVVVPAWGNQDILVAKLRPR